MPWAAALVVVVVVLVLLRRRRHALIRFAAYLEQGRREHAHHVEYRPEQRVHAVQQRLSRHLGAKAFTTRMQRQIDRELHGMDDR